MNNLERVKEFHKAFGQPVGEKYSEERGDLRYTLIIEEATEVGSEIYREEFNIKKLAKELADLLYVTYGTAVEFGIPLQEVFVEVHKSNMSKLGEDGKAIFREDGKVLKGPNYKEADIERVFSDLKIRVS